LLNPQLTDGGVRHAHRESHRIQPWDRNAP
jgi:hypothetical protein